jgi:GAF domain-containing protein/FHA domain-containing protein
MAARLTVFFSSSPARVYLLPDSRQTVVGRDPGCDVALDDERVSRRHAILDPQEAGWTVSDTDSKNGILIDGMPLASGLLRERSWLSFGGLIARFETLREPVEKLEEERLRRFSTSIEIRRGLDPGLGLAELLPRVVASMLELTNAERGFLLLADPGGDLEVAAHSGSSWEDVEGREFGGSLGAVRRVLAAGEPVVSADARADAELGERASVVVIGIRALLCVPVRALDRLIGVLYADSRQPGAVFTELDLELLEALAVQAGLAIAVARLDAELKGLANRIAETPGADPGTRDQLSGEISTLLDRSLPAARPAAAREGMPERWTGVLTAHATLGIGT